MSNTRKISTRKLAEAIAVNMTGMPAPKAAAPVRVAPVFPRIPLSRFRELLGEGDPDEEAVKREFPGS